MARTAAWRDASKTTASGVFIPEYRLHLPTGDVIVKLIDGAAFNPKDKASHFYCVKCFSLGIYETPLGERDPEKAKKAAIELVKKKASELMDSCRQDLDALNHIIDYGKALQKGAAQQEAISPAKPQKKQKTSQQAETTAKKRGKKVPITKYGAAPLPDDSPSQLPKKRGRKKQ